jgi:hypothetical protein
VTDGGTGSRLEDLLERGEVQAALILKGDYTDREKELIRDAWDKGLRIGIEIGRGGRGN